MATLLQAVRVFSLLLLLGAGGCAAPTSGRAELFAQLGGIDGITRIIDGFLYQIGDDPRIIEFFANTNIDRFREKLIEHVCALSGGGCQYNGDSMSEVHRGMQIGEAHFNALVEDLIKAMEQQHIPVATQNRLLALLAPLHDDIVKQ